MLSVTELGLYCAPGDFYIDPWRRVDRALITHAHSDHACPGSHAYLCAKEGVELLRLRVGKVASVSSLAHGEQLAVNGVKVSFHPAGHVLGSAQIRLEYRGEVWVVSGDYKRQPDPTCAPFEPLPCHAFVTESTFGLPVYRWPDPGTVFAEINDWWRSNQLSNRTCLLFGYSLGKAQRLLAGVDATLGPIFVHEAVQDFLPAYAAAGVKLPPVQIASPDNVRAARGQALVIAPPAVEDSRWRHELGEASSAFASGWMLLLRSRRRRSPHRGFTLSDHADWPGLLQTIRETGASRVLVAHGETGPLVRWLREGGGQAESLPGRVRRKIAPPSEPAG